MRQFATALITCLLPMLLAAQTGKPAPQRLIFDSKTVGEIRLTLPVKNWNDALDSMRLYGTGMMPAQATVDGSIYPTAGVRFRGNASYQMGIKRNPFHIKLNIAGGDSLIAHQGLTSLKLSSALRDPSMVREMLFTEIAGKYMAAPQASYTNLFINDEYVGIFINVESVDAQFVKKHFDSSDNPFFKAGVDYAPETAAGCRQRIFGSLEFEPNLACYKGNFEMESERGWEEIQELTRVLNQDPKNIEKILDVDAALWMLALNNVMVNLSSYSGNYSQNYYLYMDEHGRFQPVHWDLNLAFGSFKNTGSGSDLELKDLQRLSPTLHADNPLKPLVSQLLKDPLYRKTYLAHIRQILSENFDNGWYEKRAKELQGMILTAFNDDKNKQYSLDDFQKNLTETVGRRSKIPGIVELMSQRARFLKNHPDLTALPSEITEVVVKNRGKFENQKINAFNISAKGDRFPKRMVVYYRFASDKPYQMTPMTEESAGQAAGVKVFSASVEAHSENDTLDYYIMAENAGTVSFSPSNYMSKPYMVKLSEVNK